MVGAFDRRVIAVERHAELLEDLGKVGDLFAFERRDDAHPPRDAHGLVVARLGIHHDAWAAPFLRRPVLLEYVVVRFH